MIRPTLFTVKTCFGLAALGVFLSMCLAAPVAAQQVDGGSFTLKISEKELKLESPADMMLDKYLMWDLPFQRVRNRNAPYLELTNDSESAGQLTEFRLTIGDKRFNYSKANQAVYALLGSTTPGFSITSSVVDSGDELVVNIGNGGLDPGETIRFRVEIGVDAAFKDQIFSTPDYRTILFDMNGIQVYDGSFQKFDTTDNAHASAKFQVSDILLTAGPVPFADEMVFDGSQMFYNQRRRQYSSSGNDTVRIYQLESPPVFIPEPSCAALLAIGLVGGMLTARRPPRALQATWGKQRCR